MRMDGKIQKLKQRTPSLLGIEQFAQFAILLPLIKKEKDTHLLFEVRSLQLRRQPGEICFPGGKVDHDDENEQAAAIRETCEELGIEKDAIHDVFPLDYIVSPFGMVLYPFVATLASPHLIKPNESEVDEIFTVPLSFFYETQPEIYHVQLQACPDANFPFDKIPGGKNYRWRPRQIDEYFYYYEDKVIWGLTAKIVHHFIELLRSTE
ncbi:CoA pyrophosphatase [Anoxybacillus sp. UARK-01]|uniref:NUDIX hydrolase n=1 Tax=Anoxybacillus sp. UARK-01 TaxID=1895648 RepID=UPI003511BB4E